MGGLDGGAAELYDRLLDALQATSNVRHWNHHFSPATYLCRTDVLSYDVVAYVGESLRPLADALVGDNDAADAVLSARLNALRRRAAASARSSNGASRSCTPSI